MIWPLGTCPDLATPVPQKMYALTLHRDRYGPPQEVVCLEKAPVPVIRPSDARGVLVAVLATGPNFNTNFAALGLPVPVFGRGDSATIHIPGSDALGIVVDAGPAVRQVKVGQAVILDSWTGTNIRGYETHDGFNAQFVLVDQECAIPVPQGLSGHSPERLAAILLTYGTAYRAIVERLAVGPGDSLLVMGGGKGTSFAAAQLGQALGAQVILVGSNQSLADSLIQRGIADSFVNRREIPKQVFGLIEEEEDYDHWYERTEPFRKAVLAANQGRLVDKIFEHTGGENFPLLVSTLSGNGKLTFFGATGRGLKGEYKQTFFYDRQRFVMDARWVWMRQKQILFRKNSPEKIFSEIGLLPGRRGLIWGADTYARNFVKAALQRGAELAVVASYSKEQKGIASLKRIGVAASKIIDRDMFDLTADMPDPLSTKGTPNPAYMSEFMLSARALGREIWEIFGPRTNPDFIVERPDQTTLHFSTFLLKDYDEADEMPTGYILIRGSSNLSILGSHMYRHSQARETVRLLSENKIVMSQEDLDVVDLPELPVIQQKMLDGQMIKPKGVALVQANALGRTISEYEGQYLGKRLLVADPDNNKFLDLSLLREVGIITLTRPDALNALNEELLAQLSTLIDEVAAYGTLQGEKVKALILQGYGRAFVAGADIEVFVGKKKDELERLATDNMAVFMQLENLSLPVISLVDGFALGGGNELSMSTHYRIVTENAVLGQPEVKLGIIPGYGGMQRLPRLIGPKKAAEMAVNGESVDGLTAVKIGLADEFQPACTALSRAFQVARDFLSGQKEFRRPNWDVIAADQVANIEELFSNRVVIELMKSERPDHNDAENLHAARKFAARMSLCALSFGYDNGFLQGLENDARLFAEVTASFSGQWWVKRFIDKDPTQFSFLTLLPRQ